MPALVPSWAIEVSQLPRWPMVTLSASSADADTVDGMTAEAEPPAVDDGMPHGGQVDLARHLPRIGAEAAADADQHLVDLPHAGRGRERDREEARDGAHRHLRAGTHAEPHDHHREEDDLG